MDFKKCNREDGQDTSTQTCKLKKTIGRFEQNIWFPTENWRRTETKVMFKRSERD